ncbi:MAG: hypothetical protein WDO56_10895 [Gammaproteobacteria bacterium]
MSSSPRPRPEVAKLDALSALEAQTDRPVLSEAIGKSLQDKNYRVVARAASFAEERQLHELLEDLLAAYARFLQDPVKR